MLYFGLAAFALVVSGSIGGHMASAKGRNALDWFWICMFLPGAGHLLLHLRPAAKPSDEASGRPGTRSLRHTAKNRPAARSERSTPQALPHRVVEASGAVGLQQHWSYLVEADPILNAAARKLAPLGPEALQHLRDAFFAQQDRTLVPGMVARIETHFASRSAKSTPPPLKKAPPPVTHATEPPGPAASATARDEARPAAALSSLTSARAGTAGVRATPAAEPPLRTLAQAMPATAARLVPRHTTVTPQDLDTAEYLETYRGIHLYRLMDGRIYIDGHLALASLDAARSIIAQAARTAMAATAAPPVVPAAALTPASASPL